MVVIATKAQAAESVLVDVAAAAAAAGEGQPAIVCCTNGISVERTALRHFERVYGVMVEMPGTHLTPGTTFCHRAAPHGFLPVGRYPDQPPDELCERIGADFAAAGLVGGAVSDIMQLKNRKCAANPSQLDSPPPAHRCAIPGFWGTWATPWRRCSARGWGHRRWRRCGGGSRPRRRNVSARRGWRR